MPWVFTLIVFGTCLLDNQATEWSSLIRRHDERERHTLGKMHVTTLRNQSHRSVVLFPAGDFWLARAFGSSHIAEGEWTTENEQSNSLARRISTSSSHVLMGEDSRSKVVGRPERTAHLDHDDYASSLSVKAVGRNAPVASVLAAFTSGGESRVRAAGSNTAGIIIAACVAGLLVIIGIVAIIAGGSESSSQSPAERGQLLTSPPRFNTDVEDAAQMPRATTLSPKPLVQSKEEMPKARAAPPAQDNEEMLRARSPSPTPPSQTEVDLAQSDEQTPMVGLRKFRLPRLPKDHATSTSSCAKEQIYLQKRLQQHKMDVPTRELVKSAMKKDRICMHMQDEQLEQLLDVAEFFKFVPGEPVLHQGDIGSYFFVVHDGTMDVTMNGKAINTMSRGSAFGGTSLLCRCPRTVSVTAKGSASLWGTRADVFQKVHREYTSESFVKNRKLLGQVHLFDCMPCRQKDRLADGMFVETMETGHRVFTEGEHASSMFIIKSGSLNVVKGATVSAGGVISGGIEERTLGAGMCFGEVNLLHNTPRENTVVAVCKCTLLCITVENLKSVLGDDIRACLDRQLLLAGLQRSQTFLRFSHSQRSYVLDILETRSYQAGERLGDGLWFAIVMEGCISGPRGDETVNIECGECYEDDLNDTVDELSLFYSHATEGARLGVLTQDGLARVLQKFGSPQVTSDGSAADYARKLLLLKRVPLFRHLAPQQVDVLIKAFKTRTWKKGKKVVVQGQEGSEFYVVVSGELKVLINGQLVRVLGRNSYFGDRALLFDEPRTATVQVESGEAELWSVKKSDCDVLLQGNTREELLKRAQMQDKDIDLKDLMCTRKIGMGAFGSVRLVEHCTTGARYALKRVRKNGGELPRCFMRECEVLTDVQHPFIGNLIQHYDRGRSAYSLSELLTGGDLFDAVRRLPQASLYSGSEPFLMHDQAQFYLGALVLVLEELNGRDIVYRDLKPENVFLDGQGYVKLIDFGTAKQLADEDSRTFTILGTPHYMAPEIFRGKGYGTEVDLWSLGVLLFELVCGRLPFAADSEDPNVVCTAVLTANVELPAFYKYEAGHHLIKGLLCPDPTERLGAGATSYDEVRASAFFVAGHGGRSDFFDRLFSRDLRPPVIPTDEVYPPEADGADANESDAEEFSVASG